MDRRFAFTGLASLAATLLASRSAAAAPNQACVKTNSKDSVSWTVPANIRKIRVQSQSKDGAEIIDTHFSVRPGQTFVISVVKD